MLKLANVYLKKACEEEDRRIALVLCSDTEASLTQASRAFKSPKSHLIEGIATAYINLGIQLKERGRLNEAQASHKKAEQVK